MESEIGRARGRVWQEQASEGGETEQWGRRRQGSKAKSVNGNEETYEASDEIFWGT